MTKAETAVLPRRPTNLSIDGSLLRAPKSLGINISRSAEAGIAEAVRRQKREQWLQDNAEALQSSNDFLDKNGLPLAQHRHF